MSYTNKYYPKRPVKSFQDLEVYQKLLAVCVAVAKRITSNTKDVSTLELKAKLTTMALDLPLKVAAAHSLRFGDQTRAIEALEEVMLNCNLLVVYLEQYRDIDICIFLAQKKYNELAISRKKLEYTPDNEKYDVQIF